MENSKLPAYSLINYETTNDGATGTYTSSDGFTKLERAAVAIAASMMGGAWSDKLTDNQLLYVKESAVVVAKAVLEECNK